MVEHDSFNPPGSRHAKPPRTLKHLLWGTSEPSDPMGYDWRILSLVLWPAATLLDGGSTILALHRGGFREANYLPKLAMRYATPDLVVLVGSVLCLALFAFTLMYCRGFLVVKVQYCIVAIGGLKMIVAVHNIALLYYAPPLTG